MTFKEFVEKKGKGIALLILACVYIISPYDVLMEDYVGQFWGCTDDILAFIMACIKSYSMGKA